MTLLKGCKKDFERQIYIKSTKMKSKILQLTALTILLLIASCSKSKHYELSIVDGQTAEPLAARISVTDLYGQCVHIDGTHSDVEYLGKKWCYADGLFSVTTTEKGLILMTGSKP